MACCFFTAFFINRIIQACELLDVSIEIKYNDFSESSSEFEKVTLKQNSYVSTKLSLSRMTCGACVGNIQTALTAQDGVHRAAVSLSLQSATVVFDTSKLSVKDLVRSVEEAGYGAQSGDRSAEQQIQLLQRAEELQMLRTAFTGAAVLSSISAFLESSALLNPLAMIASKYHILSQLLSMGFAIYVQLFYASWIYKSAWISARGGHVTMDTLISLSLMLGIWLSIFNMLLEGPDCSQTYFASCSFLTTVIAAGRYLDLLLRRHSATNIVALYRLHMESAAVKLRGTNQFVPAILLREHDEIIIGIADIIPCDCYVIEGTSALDESIMTGEALPVTKSTGDFLLSGTRNLSGRLVAVVHRVQQDSSLDNLIESISTASEQSSSGQEKINATTSYFVTGVLLLTAACFLVTYHHTPTSIPPLHRLNTASERAMTVLAAACPCALGLANPSAIMAGIDAAWARGVILSGGARTIEQLARITHVVLDKTGTLTEGRLHVSAFDLISPAAYKPSYYHRALCAAEEDDAQTQPVAKAVFQWCLRQLHDPLNAEKTSISHLPLPKIHNRTSIPGKGISCTVAGPGPGLQHTLHIGSLAFLHESAISAPFSLPTSPTEPSSTTSVYFALDRIFTGSLTLHDTIRPEAPAVLAALASDPLSLTLTLLTGDVAPEAARVASTLNLTVLGARALPHEKRAAVIALQAEGARVAMVGDGLNDAAAHAAAHVGIQLALSRACVAGAADVLILSPNLHALPALFSIARKTVAQARYNVYWAVAYNSVAISFALGAFEGLGLKASVSVTGTMMAFSSAAILGASLLLRRRLRSEALVT